jgi:UDP-MurNAc hydroxylase
MSQYRLRSSVGASVVITYLGHAGFFVESDRFLLVADPWLSASGAFDGAWFQFPRNHDLAPIVRQKLRDFTGERYIYLSHEHRDHFDLEFLSSIEDREFTLLVPQFANDRLLRHLDGFACRELIALPNEGSIPVPGGSLTLYVDDSELNRDSALVVRDASGVFFNMNDCKLFDALSVIASRDGAIDVFACQFSGATWHPTCYDYDEQHYATLSKKKAIAKFERVARAIETLAPKMYLPSAGPPCFLDPQLFDLNFEPSNIFPHQERLAAYLEKRLRKRPVPAPHLLPGDRVTITPQEVTHEPVGTPVAEPLRAYLEDYAAQVGPIFADRAHEPLPQLYSRLRDALGGKLELFELAARIDVPLYFMLAEAPEQGLRVDFAHRTVGPIPFPEETERYTIVAPAWEVQRVLDGALTWEELSLTFRVRLSRTPDLYQPLLHAFLLLQTENVARFCRHVTDRENDQDRMLVEAGAAEYSVLLRCPHQGADLSEAEPDARGIITCPRHGWQFDVTNGGKCLTNGTSLCAVPAVRERAVSG